MEKRFYRLIPQISKIYLVSLLENQEYSNKHNIWKILNSNILGETTINHFLVSRKIIFRLLDCQCMTKCSVLSFMYSFQGYLETPRDRFLHNKKKFWFKIINFANFLLFPTVKMDFGQCSTKNLLSYQNVHRSGYFWHKVLHRQHRKQLQQTPS